MARRRVDRLCHPRRRSIATAVIRRAQERATFHHAPRDVATGMARIAAAVARTAAWIVDRAAGLLDLAMVLIPIARPLPDVACHIEQSEAIGRERAYRRGPLEA